MKILKQNLLKTIVGAGLVLSPFSARGQAKIQRNVLSDTVMGGGVTYTIEPHGKYNVGGILNYGVLEEMYDDKTRFRGMAMMNAYGIVSNTYLDDKNFQSYGAGFLVKIGAGWNKMMFVVSKGLSFSFNTDSSHSFADRHSVGLMYHAGNYTRLYGDYVLSRNQIISDQISTCRYEHAVELGVIYTLFRCGKTK